MKKDNGIFLDFDGVLCTPRACVATKNEGVMSYLDPIACLLVKRLCEEHNAKLIISSTWRKFYSRDAMKAILNAACTNLGNYMFHNDDCWRTPSLDRGFSSAARGHEIAYWLEANPTLIEHFVILDDDSDMADLMHKLVRCDAYDGFGYRNYIQATAHLQGKIPTEIKW